MKNKKGEGKIESQVTQDLIKNFLSSNNSEYQIMKKQLLVAGRNRAVLKNLYETWKGRQSLLQSLARMVGDSHVMPKQIIDIDWTETPPTLTESKNRKKKG